MMVDGPSKKLELLHAVSDLVEKNGLWIEIARLGMTREFIGKGDNLYARIIMELELIETHAPAAVLEAKRLKSLAASLSLTEQNAHERQDRLRIA